MHGPHEGSSLAASFDSLGLPPREALEALSSRGVRGVQWSATMPGVRPRELDASARRDLRASLRRLELELVGVDLFIPPEHFRDATRVDRAIAAVEEAVRFAADFARVAVSLRLPREAPEVVAPLLAIAERAGVRLADHELPLGAAGDSAMLGVGLDPVALLAAGLDPAAAMLEQGAKVAVARLADLGRDGVRIAPRGGGDGRLDLRRYRVAIEVAGRRPAVVIDPRQWRDPLGGIVETVAAWEDAGRPEDAAPRGLKR